MSDDELRERLRSWGTTERICTCGKCRPGRFVSLAIVAAEVEMDAAELREADA